MHQCTVKNSDYESSNLYTWCTNCGNYGINGALRRALVEECIEPHNIVLCFDIGCNGNGADKINGYTVHGLHGRVLPLAAGISLANRKIPVIASAGDGATLGEGINHLIHSIRANYNITFLLHNNSNYGLTTGQASATTPKGVPMSSYPDGVTSTPLNIVQFVLGLNPSFVARAFSGNIKQLTSLIRAGLNHNGFSFIEILQDCPTYNQFTPHTWYQERVYSVDEVKSYDKHDIELARTVSADLSRRIATGLIYQNESAIDAFTVMENRKETLSDPIDEVKPFDITQLLSSFK